MLHIWFEISLFDLHPVWFAGAVSTDLNADQPPGAVKCGTADSSGGIYDLLVITIEDRRQIGTLIRDGWINVDQNTDRE